MAGVTLDARVSSQIPRLVGQFGSLKNAASSLAQTINAQAQRGGAIAQALSERASANAARTRSDIERITSEFHRQTTVALADSQALISSSITGAKRPVAERVRDVETAKLAGPGVSQFSRIAGEMEAKIAALLDDAKFLDRLGELAIDRARVALSFQQQSTLQQQEQTALFKDQNISNLAIQESAKVISEQRRADFAVMQQIAELAGKDPQFVQAQSRISNKQIEQELALGILKIGKEKFDILAAENSTMKDFIANLQTFSDLSEQDIIKQIEKISLTEQEIQLQNQIQASIIDTARISRESIQQRRLAIEDFNTKQRAFVKSLNDERAVILENSRIRREMAESERLLAAEVEKTAKKQQQQFQAQSIAFARQPFVGGLGRLPRDPESARLEQLALGIQEKVRVTNADGISTRRLSEEEARLVAARTAGIGTLKRYNQEYQIANGLLRRNRAQLINNSIGMFVLSITITQTIAGLEQMVKAWAESSEGARFFGVSIAGAAEFLGEMNQVVRFSIGPIQVYTSILQLASQANRAFFMTSLPMLAVFGSVGLVMKALTSESKNMRKVFSVLALGITSVGTAIAAYNLNISIATLRTQQAELELNKHSVAVGVNSIMTTANSDTRFINTFAMGRETTVRSAATTAVAAETIANVGLFTIKGGLLTLKTLGAGAILVASIIGLMASIFATVKAFTSFETQPGEFKTVGKTGTATVHEGERIFTPATIGSQGVMDGTGGITIINNIAGNLDTSVPRMMVKRLRSGQIGGTRF